MYRRTAIVCALFLVLSTFGPAAGAAFAVADPSPDGVGVYFDENADVGQAWIAAYTPFYVHVVLTNPTLLSIEGAEFGWFVQTTPGSESSLMLFSYLEAGDPDVTLPINELDPLGGDVDCHWSSPLPTQETHVLLTLGYMLMTNMWADISIVAGRDVLTPDGLPSYWNALGVCGMGANLTCSGRINLQCDVGTETRSFGEIKALYR